MFRVPGLRIANTNNSYHLLIACPFANSLADPRHPPIYSYSHDN